MKLTDKTLLIISNGYPSKDGKVTSSVFVKTQVNELKKYFKKIIIISPQPYFPKLLSNFSFISKNFKNRAFCFNYKYDNVEVYVNISDGAVEKWNALPLGSVEVSKVQIEDSTYHTYNFKGV